MRQNNREKEYLVGPIKLKKALEHFRLKASIYKRGYEQERYRIIQIQRSFLGKLYVYQITSVDIAKYRDIRLEDKNKKTGKPLSPATIRMELSVLSRFFELARIEFGFTTYNNPCMDVRKPAPSPSRTRRLSPREERNIRRYCKNYHNPELGQIFQIALATAMRQGEILRLQWDNIDFKKRIAHLPVTKNGSPRDVPLSNEAMGVFKTIVGEQRKFTSGPVFTYKAHGLKTAWRKMTIDLKIENLHFHDLRHEAISRLFELGTLDMMEVATISGHKSLSMLKRYTHLNAAKLVNKLEGPSKRSYATFFSKLQPYPAVEKRMGEDICFVFPDFRDKLTKRAISTDLNCESNMAKSDAKELLLRTLLSYLQQGKRIPTPGINCQENGHFVMIDPLN